ncbi:MAG TPA: phage integrase N-terminal SAM-like domain-containing protein [Polyangiaceae bacterium]|nr:phage integrase N-terminal SAM-like domain-containing protein [Polyangiaceae bacterium]
MREFIRFHHKQHPRTMGAREITAFLNELATQRRVSASTQNQALCAIVFLYKRVLDMAMPDLSGLEPARRPMHLPAVLSRREVLALLDKLEPPFRLMGEIFYGAGLRLMECVSLRSVRGENPHERGSLTGTSRHHPGPQGTDLTARPALQQDSRTLREHTASRARSRNAKVPDGIQVEPLDQEPSRPSDDEQAALRCGADAGRSMPWAKGAAEAACLACRNHPTSWQRSSTSGPSTPKRRSAACTASRSRSSGPTHRTAPLAIKIKTRAASRSRSGPSGTGAPPTGSHAQHCPSSLRTRRSIPIARPRSSIR